MLSNLPIAITLWTALTISWGIYTLIGFSHIIRADIKANRPADSSSVCNANFLVLGITAFSAYLILHPYMVVAVPDDAMIVLNVFFDIYLASAAMTLSQWWKANHPKSNLTLP